MRGDASTCPLTYLNNDNDDDDDDDDDDDNNNNDNQPSRMGEGSVAGGRRRYQLQAGGVARATVATAGVAPACMHACMHACLDA